MALVKYNNNSLSAITAASSLPAGAMTLIKEVTASSDSSITFAHGTSDVVLDSTYPIYLFKYINVHPSNDGAGMYVNFRDGSTSYDATKTTTNFYADHTEEEVYSTAFAISSSDSMEQTTSAQKLTGNIGSGNDECSSGDLWLFNPSSTTYVKHFFGTGNEMQAGDSRCVNLHYSGYCNVTAAIDGVQFTISAGTIDTGTFKLYGIKDS